MEDESGGEGLFNISTDPEDDSGFARILYNKDISLLEDPEKESDGRQSIKCFNCGGEHSLRDCKEPIDRNALAKNRAQFQRKNGNRPGGDFRRYHLQVEDESKDMGKAVPGIISDRLRDALGITEDQIPPYVYKMRILGYPPGWLEEAKTGHSGINMIDSKGERVPDPDDEEGEIVTTRPRYDLSKIIDYPGFNVWPHPNTINDTDIYGVPQMSMDHSKAAFVQMLQDEMDSDDVVMEDSFTTIDEAVARDGGDDEEEEEGECPRESPPPRLNDNERRISTEVVEPVPASHSTPKLKPEEANRASEEQLDFDSSFGRIKSVEMGTPALKIHSPYSLPPPEAFRKDITDVIFFENLPNATGKYENLKKLLKDVRSKIHTLKNTSEGEAEEEDDADYESKPKKARRVAKMKAAEMERAEREKKERELEERKKKEEKQEMIQKLVEDAEPTENDILDDTTLKRMLLLFEKKALKNQEMRIKFPDTPDKFMESELELHEAVHELHAIATVPDLYPILVQLNAVGSLLDLLSHENTDISVAVVDLLQELTDIDTLHENLEGADALIDALVSHQAPSLLLHNIQRLDENVKEEADGVHNTLAIIENLIELRPELVSEVGKQGLLQWLLKRLKSKVPAEQNKLYATEILSILLQNNLANKTLLGELGGVDILLQQLAHYKRHDPTTAEDCEIMENLFDSLCCCLMVPANKDLFLKGEGLQLMNLMLREKKLSRNGSLKVVNYALNGPDGKDNCNKFVDILGLRTIFPLFMKTPKKNRKKMLTAEEHEEHVVSIIASMLRNCKGPQRSRLLSKFTENDHEKVDRLLELHFKYMEKVEAVDTHIEHQLSVDKDMDEDEIYLKRLDGGLFTLQLIDYIMLEICAAGPPTVKQRVTLILNQRGVSLKTIRHIMREYAGNLGDDGDAEWKEMEQQHILQLVDKF